jgi:hypothetical protein
VMTLGLDGILSLLAGPLALSEIAAPASPGTDIGYLYVASLGGVSTLYFKDQAGTVFNLLAGSLYTVATDPIWAAAGDIAVATGNDAASILAKGNNDEVLTMVAGAVAWAAAGAGGGGDDVLALAYAAAL